MLLELQNAASRSAYAAAYEVFQWLETVQSATESVILSLIKRGGFFILSELQIFCFKW